MLCTIPSILVSFVCFVCLLRALFVAVYSLYSLFCLIFQSMIRSIFVPFVSFDCSESCTLHIVSF